MSAPTVQDAKARRPVLMPDGSTGRLLSVPGGPGRRKGAKARVVLPSGAVRSFPPEQLEVLDDSATTVAQQVVRLDGRWHRVALRRAKDLERTDCGLWVLPADERHPAPGDGELCGRCFL